jgi:uncharacterized cupin superfamily protein
MGGDVDLYAENDWERELGTARSSRLAPAAGLTELGCALYELDPGGQAAPYHMHHGNDELLIVLDGSVELRTPEGTRTLTRGAFAGFPKGPGGAHRIRNVSGEKARYVLVSTMRFPEVAEQLDTGTILAMGEPSGGWAFPAGSERDYVEMTREAIEADSG